MVRQALAASLLALTLASNAAATTPVFAKRQTGSCSSLHLMVAGGCDPPCTDDVLGLLESLASSVTSSISDADLYLVPYDGSENQAAISSNLMIQAANQYSAQCPNTPIVFLGYSLGGIIVMNTLCGGIDYNPNVIAAISYGEETFTYPQPYDKGTCRQSAPLYARGDTSSCQQFAPIIQSYCDSGDPRCCTGGTTDADHFGYANNYDSDALAFITSNYVAFKQSNPNTTSSTSMSSTMTSTTSTSSSTSTSTTTSTTTSTSTSTTKSSTTTTTTTSPSSTSTTTTTTSPSSTSTTTSTTLTTTLTLTSSGAPYSNATMTTRSFSSSTPEPPATVTSSGETTAIPTSYEGPTVIPTSSELPGVIPSSSELPGVVPTSSGEDAVTPAPPGGSVAAPSTSAVTGESTKTVSLTLTTTIPRYTVTLDTSAAQASAATETFVPLSDAVLPTDIPADLASSISSLYQPAPTAPPGSGPSESQSPGNPGGVVLTLTSTMPGDAPGATGPAATSTGLTAFGPNAASVTSAPALLTVPCMILALAILL